MYDVGSWESFQDAVKMLRENHTRAEIFLVGNKIDGPKWISGESAAAEAWKNGAEHGCVSAKTGAGVE